MKDLEDLLKDVEEIEVENFRLDAEEIEFELLPQAIVGAVTKALKSVKGTFKFTPPIDTYNGRVLEAVIGATRSDGGTRKSTIKLGGQSVPPLHFFEGSHTNMPIVSHDVFDVPFRIPKTVTRHFGDAIKDPAEWAKKQVNDFGAKMITLHLISTDPLMWNRSAKQAAKTVEDVLQAVDVPIIISGSGNYKKDVEVLTKAAESASGERALISSVCPDMDYKKIVNACKEHGHLVLSLVSTDVPGIKQMNKNIIKEGLPAQQIIMDPNTASIGYGIEYSITTMERIRLNALKGDKDLAMPILSGASNAWSAREAWMRDEKLGPKEFRGPLWETITATIALFSGAELFMMLHPAAMKTIDEIIGLLFGESKRQDIEYKDWMKI